MIIILEAAVNDNYASDLHGVLQDLEEPPAELTSTCLDKVARESKTLASRHQD